MYKITWVDERPEEEVQRQIDAEEIAMTMGSDGAIMTWLDDVKTIGIINYYNSIVAYVTYEPEPEENDVKEIILRGALQQLDRDTLIVLCEEYNKYVQDVVKDKPVNDLLTYFALKSKDWIR